MKMMVKQKAWSDLTYRIIRMPQKPLDTWEVAAWNKDTVLSVEDVGRTVVLGYSYCPHIHLQSHCQ